MPRNTANKRFSKSLHKRLLRETKEGTFRNTKKGEL